MYKEILVYILVALLGFGLGYFTGHQKPEVISSKIETVKGEGTQEKKEGKTDTVFIQKKYYGKTVLPKIQKTKIWRTENYTLTVTATMEDSLRLEYFLNIREKTVERIDTLLITRVDTLKTVEHVVEPQPFFNTFWFGATAGTIATILIILATK